MNRRKNNRRYSLHLGRKNKLQQMMTMIYTTSDPVMLKATIHGCIRESNSLGDPEVFPCAVFLPERVRIQN